MLNCRALKTILNINFIRHLTLFRSSLILGEQDWDRVSFQTEVSGLIHLIMVGRLRHASGPAHIHRVCYIDTDVSSSDGSDGRAAAS